MQKKNAINNSENSLILEFTFMKKLNDILLVFLLALTLLSAGCSSSKKNNCGCPNKKGMVGY